MNTLNYIKYGILLIVISAIIWFVKDYVDKSEFKKDTETNAAWQEKFDSLRISYTILNDKQMNAYLKDNEEMKSILKENNIKSSRVTSILNHLLKYRDTTIVETDLSKVLEAINKKTDYSQPFKDSTSCLLLKGKVKYANGGLSVEINERVFNSNTTAIAYWERKQWNFLGIKTRFLGKKEMTAKVIDKCGTSQTINIEKAK